MLQEEKLSLAYYIENSEKKLAESLDSKSLLQSNIDQQNQEILALNQQLQHYETYRNDSNKNIEELYAEIAQLKQDCNVGHKSLAECQQQLFTTMQELSEKTHAFNDVMQQMNGYQHNVELLENEVANLRHSLELKEREYSDSIENLKKTRLIEIETHYEEVLAAKDIDFQTAMAQLQESLQQNHLLNENLNIVNGQKIELEAKTSELGEKIVSLEDKLSEQLKLMDEEEKQLQEMSAIIEEQVVKIEELKKELFGKSNDYDSLVAEMDMGRKNPVPQQGAQVSMKIDLLFTMCIKKLFCFNLLNQILVYHLFH